MGEKIIVCGGNGAGKSTLGKCLAERLGYHFMDIEDYYFPKDKLSYCYEHVRTRAEVCALLLEDMKKYENLVLASVKGDYGSEVESLYTRAVLLEVPGEERLARVKKRSFDKFGERMLEGGDLYEKEQSFFCMVEERPGHYTRDWLNTVAVPVTELDGTKPIEENVKELVSILQKTAKQE